MGFFKAFTKPVEEEDILTSLDIPDMNDSILRNIPPSPNPGHKSYQFMARTTNAMSSQSIHELSSYEVVSPSESTFSKSGNASYTQLMTSGGLKGEQERNLILEQQVKILSHQAALALDKLNEISKENEYLRNENNELSKRKFRDLIMKDYRHQTSVSSNGSNGSNESSIFSKRNKRVMSQHSCNSSIFSHNQSHTQEFELDGLLKKEYEEKIEALNYEISSLRYQIRSNETKMDEFQLQIASLKKLLDLQKAENSSLLTRLYKSKDVKSIELDYYKKQVNELLKQLEEKREADFKLRQRLHDFQNVSSKLIIQRNNSRVICWALFRSLAPFDVFYETQANNI